MESRAVCVLAPEKGGTKKPLLRGLFFFRSAGEAAESRCRGRARIGLPIENAQVVDSTESRRLWISQNGARVFQRHLIFCCECIFKGARPAASEELRVSTSQAERISPINVTVVKGSVLSGSFVLNKVL